MTLTPYLWTSVRSVSPSPLRFARRTAGLVLFACALDGCALEGSYGEEGKQDPSSIIGGSKATGYEEAALVSMLNSSGYPTSACSGSIIAPRVVLTAGHCVDGVPKFKVTFPYAPGGVKTATSSKKLAYDWINVPGSSVDPDLHDVGLIVLDAEVKINKWPVVRKTPIAFGSNGVNIGRINNGSFSNTDLFVSKPIKMLDGKGHGFPYDYYSNEVIQSGDSGGPVEVPDTNPHEIIAVNSGAGGGTQVLARTDLLYDWIVTKVNENGGFAPPPDGGGGGGGGGGAGDLDGDGVPDAQDLCSKTPAGAPVWTYGEWIGCAAGQWRDGGGGADSDGDGVPDNKDLCSKTPSGAPVWQYGEWMGCGAGQYRDKG